MKTIILPTDFSKNATHAITYGAQLAKLLSCKVMLMHAYEAPVAISEYGSNVVYFHTVKDQILQRLEKEKQSLQQKFGQDLLIDTVAFDDNLIGHIAELYAQPDAVLVVIGLTGAGMIHFFLGSNTLDIVNNVGKAVLTIPPFTPFKPVRRIVFAFDLWGVHQPLPVKRIKRVTAMLNAELYILNLTDESNRSEGERNEEIEKLRTAMGDIPYRFYTITGKKIAQQINDFAREHRVDMLAIVPREKGFIENLMGEYRTKTLLFHSGIPILTIPPDEE